MTRNPVRRLFTLTGSLPRDPEVERWMTEQSGELGAIARRWFEVIRGCGTDVRETMHDGQPTACVSGAAFAYVDAFRTHVNVGFFQGAVLADPDGLLEGNGRYMRHVRLTASGDVDDTALSGLIQRAYGDIKREIES